jgi:hypothetical protein
MMGIVLDGGLTRFSTGVWRSLPHVNIGDRGSSIDEMKIDRDRFLVLAAAMAGGVTIAPGCISVEATRSRVVVETEESPAEATTTTTAAPLAAASDAGGGAQTPDPYKGTPVTAQSCNPALNNVGTPPSCTLTAPGPTCESFSDTKQECPTLTKKLKPRVARAAIECLKRKSGTQEICEFNVTGICAYEALGSACLDPSAKAVCNKVVAKCGAGPQSAYNKMSRESCEAGVSGVADVKRAKFISCITEFCRFEGCIMD